MLFYKIYNWIKYKTLPTSTLFKNRLFVERDSKNKRILTNLGLIFRNSKWGNYENYNIKNFFKVKYSKISSRFLSFIFFALLFYYDNFYNNLYIFNSVFFIFWSGIDVFDYYLIFFTWFAIATYSLVLNLIYSFFFYNSFADTKRNPKPIPSEIRKFFIKNQIAGRPDVANLTISKKDYKWALLFWLNNYTKESNRNDKNKNLKLLLMGNVFETSINKKTWSNYYNFFTKLFKITRLFNLNNESNSIFNLIYKLDNVKIRKTNNFNFNFYLNENMFVNKYFNVISWYILKNYTKYFNQNFKNNPSCIFLNQKNNWNLQRITCDLVYGRDLLINHAGLFYLNTLKFEQFIFLTSKYNEFFIFNNSIINQLNNAKWFKWLYKYSILHRKMFKNSHKLTLSKKILNSGFYNTDLTKRNIWLSENFNKNSTKNLYYFTSKLFYPNLLENDLNLTFLSQIKINNNLNFNYNFKLLNLYENSYFWFIKRFYIYNNLNTNKIISNIYFKQTNLNSYIKNDMKNLNLTQYITLLSYFLKSSNFNLYEFNIELLKLNSYIFYTNKNLIKFKDLFLFFNDKNLLNKDNLDILYWITLPSHTQNYRSFNMTYFNYLNTYDIIDISETKFLMDNVENYNEWINYSNFIIDNIYQNDLLLLNTLLIK